MIRLSYFLLSFLFLTYSFQSYSQFSEQIDINRQLLEPVDLKCYDLDGDGDKDFLVASGTENKICWYENLGGFLFGSQKIISNTAMGARAVHADDLDGDGDLEVIAASYNDYSVSWFDNLGSGNFDSARVLTSNIAGPISLFTADMDGDGDTDILTCTYIGFKVQWFQNWGFKTFSTQKTISAEQFGPKSVEAADFDNDGHQDVLSASFLDGKVAWYRNLDTLLQFSQANIIDTFANAEYAHAVDIDGDLDLDVVVSTSYPNEVIWFENNGIGSFGPRNLIASSIYNYGKIKSADIDADGDIDLFVSNRVHQHKYVKWLRHDSLGTFTEISNYAPSIGRLSAIDADDLDGDGDKEIFYAQEDNSQIGLFDNLGSGAYDSTTVIIGADKWAESVIAADLDGDTDQDVIVAFRESNIVAWYENLGIDSFSVQKNIHRGLDLAQSVRAFDVDNDGDNDIVAGGEKQVLLFENSGSGNFNLVQVVDDSIYSATDMDFADLDNDGLLDLIVTHNYISAAWYRNLGNMNFGSANLLTLNGSQSNQVTSVLATDVNNDNAIDIVVTSNIHSRVMWFKNLGGGQFSTQIFMQYVAKPYELVSADLDNDGYQDIIVCSWHDDRVSWLRNLRDETFSSVNNIYHLPAGSYNPVEIAASDFDFDGDIDVVSVSEIDDKAIRFHENIGAGMFAQPKQLKGIVDNGRAINSADLNADGSPDIIAGSRKDHKVVWFENKTGLQYSGTGTVFHDVNQNGIKDSTDKGIPLAKLTLSQNDNLSFTNIHGQYSFKPGSATTTVTHNMPDSIWQLSTASSTYTIDLNINNPLQDSLDFGFIPASVVTDVHTYINGSTAKCKSSVNYWISAINRGTTSPDILLKLTLADSLYFASSSIAADSTSANKHYWNLQSIPLFAEIKIHVIANQASSLIQGDTLINLIELYTYDSIGQTQLVAVDTISQYITCDQASLNKSVYPSGVGSEGYISRSTNLRYRINFQNTSQDSISTIKIIDQLDKDLDLNSFSVVASSHSVKTSILNNQSSTIKFLFDNIRLPDSSTDQVSSWGFIEYFVKPFASTPDNSPIYNTAHVYFDQDPVIISNTVLNTIECRTIIEPTISFQYPLLLATHAGNVSYQWFLNDTLIPGATLTTLTPPRNGVYSVLVIDSNQCTARSQNFNFIGVNIIELTKPNIIVSPNPAKDLIYFSIENMPYCDNYYYYLFNSRGDLVEQSVHSKSEFVISRKSLPDGIYFYHIQCRKEIFNGKLVFIDH